MSNLLIEIGNTAVKAAWSEGSVLGKTIRYQGERIMEFITSITEKQPPVVMAVVAVRKIEDDELPVLERSCQHLLLLDPAHPGVLSPYGIPDYLSYDRACTLIAAKFLFKDKPCTVFDFGTTLTIDFIDAAGNYMGGNVSPGCLTRFKALNRYSKSLPLLSIPETTEPLGTSGTAAIESGVISGIMFEIEGYIRSYPENVVIFTGGDAIYFAKRMKSSIFAVCNLGLMGMATITEEYVKKNIQ